LHRQVLYLLYTEKINTLERGKVGVKADSICHKQKKGKTLARRKKDCAD
jgi:hypothetical protein